VPEDRAGGTRREFWPSVGHVGASSSRSADGGIAVIGIAGRFPRASTVEDLWERLRDGEDCVGEVPHDRWDRARTFRLANGCRWGGFIDDFDKFDAPFFETDWAECTDPQGRVLLEVVWHLLERAGYTRGRLLETCGASVGCYVGVTNSDYSHLKAPSSMWLEATVANLNHGYIANRVSHFFDLRGPSIAVDTFCSSAATGLHLACQDLRSGDCKMAIVGGVNLLLHPDRFEYLGATRQLATHQNSRSFADGDGYIPAEAVGAVLLKPLASAVDDADNILGVIRATSVNHGGRTAAFGVPDPDAQAGAIEGCLRKAGLGPSSIGYIEASASGAALADPLEVAALRRVFDRGGAPARRWPIGSVKSNLGHSEAASAMAQLAKVLLQFEHGQLVPSIRTDPPNPRLNWAELPFYLVRDLQKWDRPRADPTRPDTEGPRRALLNSIGGGGTIVSVLLEEYLPARTANALHRAMPVAPSAEVIVLSARNPQQLRALIERMLAFVSSSTVDIGDLAYTLQAGREAMKSRMAIVARNRDEVIAGLAACLRSGLQAAGPVEAEVPVFVGEAAGANLFRRAPADHSADLAGAGGQDPSRMAFEWSQGGASISWHATRRKRRRLLVLPTYPFARERCWLAVLTHHHPELHAPVAGNAAGGTPQAQGGRPFALRHLNRDRPAYVAPRNAVEQWFVEIWEELTSARDVGIKDSFFEIGGDSMMAVLVVNRCHEAFGVQPDVSLLLSREGTIERLAIATVASLAQMEDRTVVDAMIDEITTEATR
jgi:polyketide synthase PksN